MSTDPTDERAAGTASTVRIQIQKIYWKPFFKKMDASSMGGSNSFLPQILKTTEGQQSEKTPQDHSGGGVSPTS